MLHNITLIPTLVGALTAALILGFISQKLKLSPIVGYLLAGVIVGPYSPGFVADAATAEECSEIGIILLMFGVGLHFHLKALISVQKIAVPGAIVQITAATILGSVATHFFGWSWLSGAVFGISISVASTVVLTRVLSDNRVLHTPGGHVALGWLIVEDLFTILVLVILPVILQPDGGNVWATLGVTTLKIAGLILFTLIVGQKLIPLLLTYVARTGTRDLFTLAVLVLALGIAVGSAYFFGASMALGAFLAGMVVGQSEFSARAASEALPMRDAFAVLFFVSVGMLFNPADLVEHWQLILVTLAIVMLGKPLASLIVVLFLRKPLKLALIVSVALAQIGEFSFILAAMGKKYDILPPEASGAIIVAAVISITLNPIIYSRINPMFRKLEQTRLHAWIMRRDHENSLPPVTEDTQRLIVVGFGPVGRTLVRILERNNIEPVIIEMNIDTVKKLRKENKLVVHGDATLPEVLNHAGVNKAQGIIISSSAIPSREVVEAARSINPDIPVTIYSFYLRDVKILRGKKNTTVISGEESAAIAMASHLMRTLGATEEQIDNEQRRIHETLS